MTYTIGGNTYNMSTEAATLLDKYLRRLEEYSNLNGYDPELLQDIKQRICEKLENYKDTEIPDWVVIALINDLGEAEEIFEYNENKKHYSESTKQKMNNRIDDFAVYMKNIFAGKIERDPQKWVIFGVCQWLWNLFKVDPVWWRLGFIFSVIFLGTWILAYIILAIVMPNAQKSHQ